MSSISQANQTLDELRGSNAGLVALARCGLLCGVAGTIVFAIHRVSCSPEERVGPEKQGSGFWNISLIY